MDDAKSVAAAQNDEIRVLDRQMNQIIGKLSVSKPYDDPFNNDSSK